MKQRIERVSISGKVVAIRASVQAQRGGRYRKQFIVNDAINEQDAIAAAYCADNGAAIKHAGRT
jgi:hypothetical protein